MRSSNRRTAVTIALAAFLASCVAVPGATLGPTPAPPAMSETSLPSVDPTGPTVTPSPIPAPTRAPSVTPSPIPPAVREPTWTATAKTRRLRYAPTATLLRDGTVLVAGGVVISADQQSGPTVTAELYDPDTGRWTATGKMATPRMSHTATLLPDGRVLVAGGTSGLIDPLPFATAELYDPETGTWSATDDMVVPRLDHTATSLPDGTVLVVGGFGYPGGTSGGDSRSPGSAERYDPDHGTWTAVEGMILPRQEHTATLLDDGTVLVVGGAGKAQVAAELYDPVSGSWTATGRMRTPRRGHTATPLGDGAVLIVGGLDKAGTLTTATELYDPAERTWKTVGDIRDEWGRSNHTATLLPGGQVLMTGGYNRVDAMASTEIYDPETRSWEHGTPMVEGRSDHTATRLRDGSVLVVGNSGGEPRLGAELYDPGQVH